VKFLSHEQSKEREEAVSLLYELSKSETLCEKIGSIPGAILMLVGMTSSKSDDILTVEKADKTLENLEKCENNVLQMAENGRLRPLLTQILEGTCTFFYLYTSFAKRRTSNRQYSLVNLFHIHTRATWL
jgi:3-dehydroquinate dehydratase